MIEKMYVNKSNKLKYRERLAIVYRYNKGWSVSRLGRKYVVSRKTIYKILDKFRDDGVYGLEDHRPGTRRQMTNPLFYAKVVELRSKTSWGACRIEQHFKELGFSVAHNRINTIIKQENLTRPKMGKQTKPKYIRYEAENNNDQWHIDWSIDPLTKKHLFATIDDKSRFVVYAGLFDAATEENTVIALQKAITTYGSPKEIVSDNGSHFKNNHTKEVLPNLAKLEEKYGIKHIFIRVGYPQSNGKIERFFGSYKMEFPYMNHPDVKDCLTWVHFYNFERIHQSLEYKTPASRYLGVNRI